ncbi:MAG: hypothetical protein JW808_00540 [Victivallales bacterium]|nr:hypothetical protein [Victivallales bacterium]
MKGPKVTVLGAGSLFFGRQAIWQMAHSEHLNSGTLALVDTNRAHLAIMVELARNVVKHTKVKLKIESSTNRKDVLKGSDFVVLSFADKSVRNRGIDCGVSERLGGIRMCSGDTIGPGGIFRTLRELPHIIECCRDIEKLCPEAWVINYINPTAANGIGIRLFAPKLKSFALCDGLHMPHVKDHYAQRAGIVPAGKVLSVKQSEDFDFRIAGPNHFTWLVKAAYKGRDVTPKIAAELRENAAKETDGLDTGAKAAFNQTITYELYKAFGCIPTCTGHTKEYVRFWQGRGVHESPIGRLKLWETDERYERHWEMWNQIAEFNLGTRPMSEFMEITKPDHATDIIETMWAGLNKPFFINTANGDAVPNMPSDAFLEMLCDLSMDKVLPRNVGDAPVGLRGLWQQVLDSHELTARAAIECDRELLYRAFNTDPLTVSLEDNAAIIEELLRLEKDFLPAKWFKR